MEIGGVSVGLWGLLGGAVVLFGLVLSMARNILEIWDRTRSKPPNHERYLSILTYTTDRSISDKRMDKFEEGLSGLLEVINKDRETQALARRTIHRRVNKILTGLARVQGAMGIHTGDLNDENED